MSLRFMYHRVSEAYRQVDKTINMALDWHLSNTLDGHEC
jgi:hypothetical protein